MSGPEKAPSASSATALLDSARGLVRAGRPLDAITTLNSAREQAVSGATDQHVLSRIELYLGETYLAAFGLCDRALSAYERAFRADPDHLEAIEAGRKLLASLGDWRRVARLHEVQLETGRPESRAATLVELARVLGHRLGELDTAAARLEEALLAGHADAATREQLALFYLDPRFPDEPQAHLVDGRALPADPLGRAADLLVELADEKRGTDREAEVRLLRRALGARPDDDATFQRLEAAYRATNRTDDLLRLLAGNPSPDAQLRRAALLLGMGRASEAVDAALAAEIDLGDFAETLLAALTKDDETRWRLLSGLRLPRAGGQDGDEEPSSDTDRMPRVSGLSLPQLIELSRLERARGRHAEEESALAAALQMVPNDPTALSRMSEILIDQREPRALAAYYEAAIEASPAAEQPRRLRELSELYERRLGDVVAAINARERAAAGAGQASPDDERELKRLRSREERAQQLLTALEKEAAALRDEPLPVELARRLAQAHRDAGNYDRAAELFDECLEALPTDASLYRALVELYERGGRASEVAATLLRQLTNTTDKVERLNLLRRLVALYERLDDRELLLQAAEALRRTLPGDRDTLARLARLHEADHDDEALVEVLALHAQSAVTPAERQPLLMRLSALYEKNKQNKEAIATIEQLRKIDKRDPLVLDRLAALQQAEGQLADATVAAESAFRLAATAERARAWARLTSALAEAQAQSQSGAAPPPALRTQRPWEALLEIRPTDDEALSYLARLVEPTAPARAADLWARLGDQCTGETRLETLRHAALVRWEAGEHERALSELERLLDDGGERDSGVHELLAMWRWERGEHLASLRASERLLMLADHADERLAIAVDLAERWSEAHRQGGLPATVAAWAWERVSSLSPDDEAAYVQLSELYGTDHRYAEQLACDERRLDFLVARGGEAVDDALTVLYEMALIAEGALHDPRRAFDYFKRALQLAGAHGRPLDPLDELERLAAAHGLWPSLAEVLRGIPGLPARLRLAEITAEALGDLPAAMALGVGALELDRTGVEVLPLLEQLAAAPVPETDAAQKKLKPTKQQQAELTQKIWGALVEAHQKVLAERLPIERAAQLRRRTGEIKEQRFDDASGAFDELITAHALLPSDELWQEVRRLAERSQRWPDVLALLGQRYLALADADGDPAEVLAQKLALAREGAEVAEQHVKDRVRAFRAYLRALQLSPTDAAVRTELWRLARALGPEVVVETKPLPVLTLPVGLVIESITAQRDPTLELTLADIHDVQSRPQPVTIKATKPQKERADHTLELTLSDLRSLVAAGPPDPVHANGSSSARPEPPSLPREAGGRRATPMPLVIATTVTTTPAAPEAAHVETCRPWHELTTVVLSLPAATDEERVGRILDAAEAWADGAGDAAEAMRVVGGAFCRRPGNVPLRARLGELAHTTGRAALLAVLDDAVAAARTTSDALALHLDAAEVCVEGGDVDGAELHYRTALGVEPGHEPTLARLEALYQEHDRRSALTALYELRLAGGVENLPRGPERTRTAIALAALYEQNDQPYEAIAAWGRVTQEAPTERAAWEALARLHERLGQWGRLIEVCNELVELSTSTDERVAGMQRVAELYERTLELPARAIDVYEALRALPLSPLASEAVDAARERLYQQLGRARELDQLWQTRLSGDLTIEARCALLDRRAQLIDDALEDGELAVTVARERHRLRADADAVARLARALERTGRAGEAVDVISGALGGSAPTPSTLPRHMALAELELRAGRVDAARARLQSLLTVQPGERGILALLGELERTAGRLEAYARVQEQLAAKGPVDDRVVALREAAEAHRQRRDFPAALENFERAWELVPDDASLAEATAELLELVGRVDEADARRRVALMRLGSPKGDGGGDELRHKLELALGRVALDQGDLDEAERAFASARSLDDTPPARLGLCRVAEKQAAWVRIDALTADLDELLPEGSNDTPFADELIALSLVRADALESEHRLDEAHHALLGADRLRTTNKSALLRVRLRLGQNRLAARRLREGVNWLVQVVDLADGLPAADLPALAGPVAEAAFLAASTLQQINRERRPTDLRARHGNDDAARIATLLEKARALDPRHEAALGLLGELAVDEGNVERALELFGEQAAASRDPVVRAERWERLGRALLHERVDDKRAIEAFERAMAAQSRPALYDELLPLYRRAGRLEEAARAADQLLATETDRAKRPARLREAAQLDVLRGDPAHAIERLTEALALAPGDEPILDVLSSLYLERKADEEVALLLTRALPLLPAVPDNDDEATTRRAQLWRRLGESRSRLGDRKGALGAWERATQTDPPNRTLRFRLLEAYGDDPRHDAESRRHHMALLDTDPLDVKSLRAVAQLDERGGAPDGGRRYLAILAALGQLTDAEKKRLSTSTLSGDRALVLTEELHAQIALPEALRLGKLLSLLWEAWAPGAPDVRSLGGDPDARVSPIDDSLLGRAFGRVARFLGQPKSGLFLRLGDGPPLAVSLAPPTAIIARPSAFADDGDALVRFALARALELCRPEYVLAALPSPEFARLMAGALRAFDLRYARLPPSELALPGSVSDPIAWRQQLPYRLTRGLAEQLAAMRGVEFSSVVWRKAVLSTADRAGLLAAGDELTGLSYVAQHDRAALPELARFVASDGYRELLG